MDCSLHFQDPTNGSTTYFFEEIVAAATTADTGGAIFAFASREGVDALLEEPEVLSLLRRGSFEIIVGIDAVTTRPALERLIQAEQSHPSLQARVFWNKTARLFHPKTCYFAGKSSTTMFVGSGNLTMGGLRSHFEAFTRIQMTPREAASTVRPWKEWVAAHLADIRPIDDEVLARAEMNSLGDYGEREPEDNLPRPTKGAAGQGPVLVAEIPRSGDRWNQVNFDIATIRDYFRVEPGSSQRVFLSRRAPGNVTEGREVRPCVDSGRSQNYRIELAAGKHLPYPAKGRPLAAFLKTSTRTFRYQLVMPGQPGYKQLEGLLGPPAQHRMRRRIVSINALTAAWPNNALAG